MTIQNRYEFMFYVECINGNPNGDPDMGNAPRIDPQDMHGFITDVSIKRRIRNYIQLAFTDELGNPKPGMDLIMQSATNINRKIAECRESADVDATAKEKEAVYKSRWEACKRFFDVRTFGAVMSTGANAGQVRGPVQISFGKSIDPILPLDISITRMCVADNAGGAKTVDDYRKWEEAQPEDKLRTMGRKQLISYGL
ncbi:MAG: type I CRISPR-associated protein Cas7, partial [Angelakisella sp.]|nr:type I CRISPR-associated protein Cas7 [Angelakisella sp.]